MYVCPLWLLLQVLACIGEQFDEGDEVCGVTVNIRNGKDRLEMWTKTAANEALQMSIGKQLKQMLDIPDSNKIGFVVFVSNPCLLLVWVVLGCSGLGLDPTSLEDKRIALGGSGPLGWFSLALYVVPLTVVACAAAQVPLAYGAMRLQLQQQGTQYCKQGREGCRVVPAFDVMCDMAWMYHN